MTSIDPPEPSGLNLGRSPSPHRAREALLEPLNAHPDCLRPQSTRKSARAPVLPQQLVIGCERPP